MIIYKLLKILLHARNKIQARMSKKLTKPITVKQSIWLQNVLCLFLFFIKIDEIINKVQIGREYKTGDGE